MAGKPLADITIWDIPNLPTLKNSDRLWWRDHGQHEKKVPDLLAKLVAKKEIARVVRTLEEKHQDLYNIYGSATFCSPGMFKTSGTLSWIMRKYLDGQDLKVALTALYAVGYTQYGDVNLEEFSADDDGEHLRVMAGLSPLSTLGSIFALSGDKALCREALRKVGPSQKMVEKIVFEWDDFDLLKLALEVTPVVADNSFYKRALDECSAEVFDLLCRTKFEHEQKYEKMTPAPTADDYIERYIANKPSKPRQAKKPDPSHRSQIKAPALGHNSPWEKHEETAIYRAHPTDRHGTRLVDLFDFAAKRVLRYQQMSDGRMHSLNDWRFRDYDCSAHLEEAAEMLKSQGGNPDKFTVKRSTKTARRAQPAPDQL